MAVEAVMPIFRAAVDAAEQHILRMHLQDFGAADAPSVAGASPYMADLVRHISHCRCAAAAGGRSFCAFLMTALPDVLGFRQSTPVLL